ncbi:MAG TPA: pyrimidine 5'-nucleotidase [Rhodospirillales bacterium]|nr:pyrimidine 5'-nucleotidase [Rhodospirillales bacterium]
MDISPNGQVRAEAWLFDLDNTLYDASTGVFDLIDERMRSFIAGFLDLDLDEAFRVQKRYFREYGTTLRGLIERHGVEPERFLEHVHDIDLAQVSKSPALDGALARLPGRKIVFTNASAGHAERIMDRLGVAHHFEGVFDIARADYTPKPEPLVYERLIGLYGLDPASTVILDDMARNLAPAAALGMTTVWVRTNYDWGREGSDGGHVHHIADNLIEWLEGAAGG